MMKFGFARATALGLMVALIGINAQAAEKLDSALLKENQKLALENRAAAIAMLKSMGVATSSAMPAGGTQVEINHNIFVLNQETFKQLAAKLGAKPVATEVSTSEELVVQNNAILMGNAAVMKSAAAALKIEVPDAKAEGTTYLEKNNALLKMNKLLLAKMAEATKK